MTVIDSLEEPRYPAVRAVGGETREMVPRRLVSSKKAALALERMWIERGRLLGWPLLNSAVAFDVADALNSLGKTDQRWLVEIIAPQRLERRHRWSRLWSGDDSASRK